MCLSRPVTSSTGHCMASTSTVNLARAANRRRRKLHPKQPTDLSFTVDRSYIAADFLVDDVTVDSKWHLVFGTPAG